MSWLGLDFCCRLVLLGGVLLGNRFRSPLEVLFTELEFRHAVLTIHAAPLGFEHYVGLPSYEYCQRTTQKESGSLHAKGFRWNLVRGRQFSLAVA